MVITPGEITLELIIGTTAYMILAYISAPVSGALAAWWADQVADELLRQKVKETNPAITHDELNDVYEFEHISQPLVAGAFAGIIVGWGAIFTLNAGFEAVTIASVGAGLVARKILERTATRFVSKNK